LSAPFDRHPITAQEALGIVALGGLFGQELKGCQTAIEGVSPVVGAGSCILGMPEGFGVIPHFAQENRTKPMPLDRELGEIEMGHQRFCLGEEFGQFRQLGQVGEGEP
jgi:hypothetical protein